jgi:hypothetical protein
MAKPKYVITATDKDGKSLSAVDRALGVVGGAAVYSDDDLAKRLADLPNSPGVTVTIRNANDG